jgi:transcription antitermination factor NusG
MPILPKQRDLYPEGLLGGGEDDPEGKAFAVEGASWLAFYTLARREKDLMRKLEAASVPFYSPLIRRRLHTAGGRVRHSYVPLFPGYVFAPVTDDQRRDALATNTIARWISVRDERMLVSDLRAIKRLIDSERPLTPEARIEPGQEVRVRSGPLRGVEGTVIKRRRCERLVVAVRLLNQGVSMELEDIDLERL